MANLELSFWLSELFLESKNREVKSFKSFCFEHLSKIIDFDSALWTTRSDMFNKINAYWTEDSFLYKQPEAFMENYFQVACTSDDPDYLNRYLVDNPNKFVDLWSVVKPADWFKTSFYKEHCMIFGIQNALAALVEPNKNTSVSHALSIYRANYEKRFNEEEVSLMNFLLPFLVQSFRLNLLYSLAPTNSKRVYRAVIDRFGYIIEAEEKLINTLDYLDCLNGNLVNIEALENLNSKRYSELFSIIKSFEHGLFFIDIVFSEVEEVLSKKELEVSKLLRNGFSNQEIADYLCRSQHTVKNQVNSILKKLCVTSRECAVIELIENYS